MSNHISFPVVKATPTKAAAAAAAGKAILDDILFTGRKTYKTTPSKATPTKATPSKTIPSETALSKPTPTEAAPSKDAPSKAAPSKAAPSKVTNGTVAVVNNNGPAKAPSLGAHQIVSIKVGSGEDAYNFYVSKAFLCHHSPYFAAAFNGNFTEGATQSMDLDGTTFAVFSVFVGYIYTSKWDPEEHEADILVGLAVLADKVLMPTLHNEAVKAMKSIVWDNSSEEIGILSIDWKWLCKNAEPGSPIRRLVIDYWAFDVKTSFLKTEGNVLPRQMLHEVSIVKGEYMDYVETMLYGEDFYESQELLPSRFDVLEDDSYLRQTDKPEEHFWWELAKSYIPPAPPSP